MTFSSLLVAASLVGSLSGLTSATAPSMGRDELLEVVGIEAPAPGTGLRIHVDFPAEAPYPVAGVLPVTAITAQITPDGDFEVVTMVAAPAAGDRSEDGLDACTDPTFVPEGIKWDEADLPVAWRFNAHSRPLPLRVGLTERSLRQGASAWARTTTDCNDDTDIAFSFDYLGQTRHRIGRDDRNVVDFGKLGGGALAVTYLWFRDGRALEFDMRFDKRDWYWANLKMYERRYQIANIATHELGHVVGLDDLGDPHGGLTMYGSARRGEFMKATLGKGDIRGAKLVSR